MTAPDLLPCPFCGYEPDGYEENRVSCRCGAMGPHEVAGDPESPTWSTRADLATVAGRWSTRQSAPLPPPSSRRRPMTAPDLLACPFCGEKPRVHHFRGCEIACPNADCPSEPTVWQWDEAEAIAAWNTRATPAAMDVPFTTCDTHVAVIGTGQHSFVAEPVFTVSDALDVPKVKALVEAAKPFADIGVGSDPDYQAVVRIDRDAVIALRAALDALREGGDNG